MTANPETPKQTHPLPGLEPVNFLAFLALLGLLRAVEAYRPSWQPRVAWSGEPPVAELHLATQVTRDDIVQAVDAGIRELGPVYTFDRANLKYTVAEFRHLARQGLADPERGRLVAALGSDGARKQDSDEIQATALCAMFGQGHQEFLERLSAMARDDDPESTNQLASTLFSVWRYEGDPRKGFRWDPVEDRRYAYQFGDPSESRNKIGTETGANRLAAIGFAVLASAPTASGLATLGVAGRRGELDVCWPIVRVPTSLAGHVALLGHPWLGHPEQAAELRAYGVRAVARSRRYQVDRYFNFERARIQSL